MSYRGRILIINNLVASSLWHRLACLDPPLNLLVEIQKVLVDFFGEKLHWVSQSVLFLSKDEGGQGLMCKVELLLFVCVLYTDYCMDPLTLTGKLFHVRF